jgi:ribonuclease P protein component
MIECDASMSAGMADGGELSKISRLKIMRLKRRADFQRAARGRRAGVEAFGLQANPRPPLSDRVSDNLGPRVGFTVTKKVGDAVVRNRIRRRLKEALRLTVNLEARLDHDYVVMARREALGRRFDLLIADLARAFSLVHSSSSRSGSGRRPNDRDKRR